MIHVPLVNFAFVVVFLVFVNENGVSRAPWQWLSVFGRLNFSCFCMVFGAFEQQWFWRVGHTRWRRPEKLDDAQNVKKGSTSSHMKMSEDLEAIPVFCCWSFSLGFWRKRRLKSSMTDFVWRRRYTKTMKTQGKLPQKEARNCLHFLVDSFVSSVCRFVLCFRATAFSAVFGRLIFSCF